MARDDDESERAHLLKRPMQSANAANVDLIRQAAVAARKELAALMSDTERLLVETTRQHNSANTTRDDLYRLQLLLREFSERLNRLEIDLTLLKYTIAVE